MGTFWALGAGLVIGCLYIAIDWFRMERRYRRQEKALRGQYDAAMATLRMELEAEKQRGRPRWVEYPAEEWDY